jgi:hypothetical protein
VPVQAVAVVHNGDIVVAALHLRQAGCAERARLNDCHREALEIRCAAIGHMILQALPALSDRILAHCSHVTLE